MAIKVNHKFKSQKADSTDASLVNPTNWNDEHNITLAGPALVGRAATGEGAAAEIGFSDEFEILLSKLNIKTVAATKVTGSFGANQIPALPASKITSGAFAADRIPSLDASKINAGTLADARIPNLNASKINAGVFADARIPKNVGIGAGQSWQNVTRSRNTSYQNTTGKPIMVSIRNHEMGGTYSGYFEVSTNGSTWLPIGEPFYDGPDKGWRFVPMGPFIVPTGHYYRYTSNKNPDWWRELR